MGSPHLEEELIGADCRSRSPLPNPSKICKNHRRKGRGSKLKRFNKWRREREMLKNTLETLKTVGKKAPLIWKAKYDHWGHFPLFLVVSGPKLGPTGPKPRIQKTVLKLFGLNSVQFLVQFLF
jgi:hypothetical protein